MPHFIKTSQRGVPGSTASLERCFEAGTGEPPDLDGPPMASSRVGAESEALPVVTPFLHQVWPCVEQRHSSVTVGKKCRDPLLFFSPTLLVCVMLWCRVKVGGHSACLRVSEAVVGKPLKGSGHERDFYEKVGASGG